MASSDCVTFLREFSKDTVTIQDTRALAKRVVETIREALAVKNASFFLLNEGRDRYDRIDVEGGNGTFSSESVSREALLVKVLEREKKVLRTGREKGMKTVSISVGVPDEMVVNEVELSLPLMRNGKLMGMVNIGAKEVGEGFAPWEVEFAETLASQATALIEKIRLAEALKRSNSLVRRADRLSSLGTLTAGLAHEIRNPLVAIKTFTQLLPERFEDEEFRSHFLRIASAEVDRIAILINELLDFARPSEPRFEPEELHTILDGMILLLSTETKRKRISVAKNYATDLPRVFLDREHIKQVFLNLLLNAAEATPENGSINVRTRAVLQSNGKAFAEVEIQDTGYGISPEYLEDIFSPFFTTKNNGIGLGLSISRQIVEEHKGWIRVDSRVDQGTSFFVLLPVNQGESDQETGVSDLQDRMIAAMGGKV
jgi:two-component system, NtrC family, sensor kinase